MSDDRRHEIRREDDQVLLYRVEEVEKDIVRIDASMLSLGSATAHLALLDARSDDNQRRIGNVEKAITGIDHTLTAILVDLARVNTKVAFAAGIGTLGGSALAGVAVALLT